MELKGIKGFAAFQAYLRLMFYLPLAKHTIQGQGRKQAEILSDFKELDDDARKGVFIELLSIAPVDDADVMRLVGVHKDKNDVPYAKSNVGQLEPKEFTTMALDTLLACSYSADDVFF